MILLGVKLLIGFVLIFGLNILIDRQFFLRVQSKLFRSKLLALALADFRNVALAVIFAGLSYWLAISGWLTGLNELLGNHGEVSQIIIWFIDPSVLNLLAFFTLGFLSGFLTRSFGFSVLLAMTLLFPSLISAPGTCLLIFGEMTGQELSFFHRKIKDIPNGALLLRFLISSFTGLAFWAGGGVLREFLHKLELNPMLLSDRILEVIYLLALVVAVDTGLSMFSSHFYYSWTKDGKRIKA